MNEEPSSPPHEASGGPDVAALMRRFEARDAKVGVIGLGYVGLPLVSAFSARGFQVTGFDVDRRKVAQLEAGESYIRMIPASTVREMVDSGRFRATVDFADTGAMDAILICVGHRLLSRLLARTRRSRQPEVPDLDHPEGGRR